MPCCLQVAHASAKISYLQPKRSLPQRQARNSSVLAEQDAASCRCAAATFTCRLHRQRLCTDPSYGDGHSRPANFWSLNPCCAGLGGVVTPTVSCFGFCGRPVTCGRMHGPPPQRTAQQHRCDFVCCLQVRWLPILSPSLSDYRPAQVACAEAKRRERATRAIPKLLHKAAAQLQSCAKEPPLNEHPGLVHWCGTADGSLVVGAGLPSADL